MENDKSALNFDIECPIKATGKYTVNGKLLFVPIEGDGDFEIITGNFAFLHIVDGTKKFTAWKPVNF